MEPSKPAAGGSKPSKVELTKLASEYLKTYVADEIDNGASHISEEAATILKFHGSYQQDDRDVRTQNKKAGKEKAFQFMVRVPGLHFYQAMDAEDPATAPKRMTLGERARRDRERGD